MIEALLTEEGDRIGDNLVIPLEIVSSSKGQVGSSLRNEVMVPTSPPVCGSPQGYHDSPRRMALLATQDFCADRHALGGDEGMDIQTPPMSIRKLYWGDIPMEDEENLVRNRSMKDHSGVQKVDTGKHLTRKIYDGLGSSTKEDSSTAHNFEVVATTSHDTIQFTSPRVPPQRRSLGAFV